MECINEGIRCGDIFKVSAGDPWPCVPEILVVTDHGNATLYVWDAVEGKHVEVWAVV